MRKTFVATLGLFAFFPAGALAEPTLKQTVDYINDTYKSCGVVLHRGERSGFLRTTLYDPVTITAENNTIHVNEPIRWITSTRGNYASDRYFRNYCKGARAYLPKWAIGYGYDRGLCPIAAETYTYTVSISGPSLSTKLKPATGNWVVLECHSTKRCARYMRKGEAISWKGKRRKIDENKVADKWRFPVCQAKKDKMHKAFSHLVKLLGGKKELF